MKNKKKSHPVSALGISILTGSVQVVDILSQAQEVSGNLLK